MERLTFIDIEEFKKSRNLDRTNTILLDYPPKDFSGISLKTIEKFNVEEFFPNKLFNGLRLKSDKLIEELYKNLEGRVVYKEIDLFSVIKYTLNYYLLNFIKYVDILDYIIENKKPKSILIKYNESRIKKDDYLNNPELSVLILKELCSAKKIPIKIKLIKKRKDLSRIDLKNYIVNILGLLQNIYFKFSFLKNSKKKKILFVGGKRAYLPILNHLKDKAKIIRCGISPGLGFFNSDQDHYITFWDKPKQINMEHNKTKIFSIISKMKYKNFSFYNLFLPNLNYLFDVYFKKLIRWIDTTYSIAPYINVAVTTNDTLPLEQIIIKILKKYKKRSYVIQHGYAPGNKNFFPLVKDKMIADKMFVWGKKSKEWMIKEGLKKENLIITGSPKFGNYSKQEKIINIRKRFNIPKNKKIICFIAPGNKTIKNPELIPSNKEYTQLYRTLSKTIKEMKKFFLIIKPHPSDENENLMKEILKNEGIKNYVITDKNFTLKPLLKQSDLIINLGESTTLEAMYLKKPILILNFFNKKPLVPFVDNGMCIGIKNKAELKESIINGIKNKDKLVKKYESYFKDYVLADGKSYKRISDVILK